MSIEFFDVAGRRRSPATLPGHCRGRIPRNKGRRFSADPPRVEEIIAVMRVAGRGHPRRPHPRAHCDHVASRVADRRGAHTGRERP